MYFTVFVLYKYKYKVCNKIIFMILNVGIQFYSELIVGFRIRIEHGSVCARSYINKRAPLQTKCFQYASATERHEPHFMCILIVYVAMIENYTTENIFIIRF